MTTLATHLRSLGACDLAVTWAKGRPLSEATWRACKRGDWLLWYAARVGVDRRLLVRAACACARTALQHVPKGEKRPRVAIETAERWARGETTLAEVRAASSAASNAAYASAAASNAAYAAYDARTASLARMATLVRAHFPWSACVAARKEQTR